MIDHGDIVQEQHAVAPPDKTVEGALAFLVRVIKRLQIKYPAERVGLLIKTAGENIVPYGKTSVSAGRICYPDYDLLVKILSDVPTTNGPIWAVEDGIPHEGHHGGYLAIASNGGAPPPVPEPEPDEPHPPPLTVDYEQAIAALHVQLRDQAERMEQINKAHDQRLRWLETGMSLPEYEGVARGAVKILGYAAPVTVTMVSHPKVTDPDGARAILAAPAAPRPWRVRLKNIIWGE